MRDTLLLPRRELIRLGALAGLGALLPARLAWAQESPAKLMPKVTAMIERWVGPGKFPGIVAALGLPGREAQFVARGSEGFTDTDAITPDSLFRIYSMTKPVTGMAAMMLIDDGKLGLDQPLADILPKFANMRVQVTPDGSITDLKPASSPIRIRNLLTHTAGLGYTIVQRGPLKAAYEEAGLVPAVISRIPVPGFGSGANAVDSLATFADRLATMPLVHEPGTAWSYSVGLDLLGRVIEVVSGRPFDAFLKERLFDPAGMSSTFFQVPGNELGRLTTNHTVVANRLAPIDPGVGSLFAEKPAFPFGGAGLVSSPRDYDRFLRMLAQFGVIDGQRVMGELAVRVGTSDLLPEGVSTAAMAGMGAAASGFGAGGRVGKGSEAGIFGWAGAAGTIATVDMRRGIRSSLFLQFTPPAGLPVLGEYAQALREDLAALAGRVMIDAPIAFAGGQIDRADHVRTDPEALAALMDWRARLLRLDGLAPVTGADGHLAWTTLADAEPDAELVFLGQGEGGRGHFAQVSQSLAGSTMPADPRVWQAMSSLDAAELATYGGARSLVDWHARHRFCARCGGATVIAKGGWQRTCSGCRAEHFPRVDPVTIMLVEHAGKVLLGRQPRFPQGNYSALAGFVEPGETIEEAVAREVFEEAGVRVHDVTYVMSQPWPFPSSLMIGCHALAKDMAITIDATELEDARWFARDEVAEAVVAAVNGGNGRAFTAPRPVAVAHHLLCWWLERA